MVTVVGHRGAAGILPENTIDGFGRAIELGVDAVECDVHLTRDGRLIVMHDATVDRTTSGSGVIAEMDLASIRALDAGNGQKPPTLDEVLEAVAGRCRLLIELKADGTEGPAVDAVEARGMADDVMFVSFARRRLANVLARDDRLQVGLLFGELGRGDLDRALELPLRHVGLRYDAVSLAAVARLREAGVQLGAWTLNELAPIRLMLAMGVNFITTDRPDMLMDYLRSGELPQL